MDLQRVKNPEKLDLCRKYFLGGFAFLPFLWFINTIWFFRDAFIRHNFAEQKKIRFYVIGSAIGSVCWIVIISTWVVIFQMHRAEWGDTGDRLSFIIPKGIP